jgi:hypothetical protein
MSANEIQPYNYGSDARNEFERKGHPGKFLQSISCGSGVTNFTSSNYGVGGIIVPAGTVGTASLSNGGTIPLATLATSSANGAGIIELSLSSVKVDSGIVYALIRNQLIR